MSVEDVFAARKRYDEFKATPLGSAFDAFDRAHATAWRYDTELGYSDNPCGGDKRAKEAWDREKDTRQALLTLLFRLAGMEKQP
jgi:hypothetical protein